MCAHLPCYNTQAKAPAKAPAKPKAAKAAPAKKAASKKKAPLVDVDENAEDSMIANDYDENEDGSGPSAPRAAPANGNRKNASEMYQKVSIILSWRRLAKCRRLSDALFVTAIAFPSTAHPCPSGFLHRLGRDYHPEYLDVRLGHETDGPTRCQVRTWFLQDCGRNSGQCG